ncbi:unnamed protein product, partial [Trichobilharzia regenti]
MNEKKKTSKPNLDNQNALLHQPTSDLTFVKVAQTNKLNETATINNNYNSNSNNNNNNNHINPAYQRKLNGVTPNTDYHGILSSDTKLDEKAFVQMIDNEGALGSIISINPEEYDKKDEHRYNCQQACSLLHPHFFIIKNSSSIHVHQQEDSSSLVTFFKGPFSSFALKISARMDP